MLKSKKLLGCLLVLVLCMSLLLPSTLSKYVFTKTVQSGGFSPFPGIMSANQILYEGVTAFPTVSASNKDTGVTVNGNTPINNGDGSISFSGTDAKVNNLFLTAIPYNYDAGITIGLHFSIDKTSLDNGNTGSLMMYRSSSDNGFFIFKIQNGDTGTIQMDLGGSSTRMTLTTEPGEYVLLVSFAPFEDKTNVMRGCLLLKKEQNVWSAKHSYAYTSGGNYCPILTNITAVDSGKNGGLSTDWYYPLQIGADYFGMFNNLAYQSPKGAKFYSFCLRNTGVDEATFRTLLKDFGVSADYVDSLNLTSFGGTTKAVNSVLAPEQQLPSSMESSDPAADQAPESSQDQDVSSSASEPDVSSAAETSQPQTESSAALAS